MDVDVFLGCLQTPTLPRTFSRRTERGNQSHGIPSLPLPFAPSPPLLLALLLLGLTGCGYTVGNVYAPEVRTIEVPIFQNDTFRRGIEYQVTEAVQREIQTRTPFRLAKGPAADTRLTGRIIDIRKDVLGETQYDDPRELQLSLFVRVTWEDLRTGQLLAQQEVPLQPQSVPVVGQAEFAPEVGQSLATATQDATERLARQIVNMLEAPAL